MFSLFSLFSLAQGKEWAVFVAGSNTYGNYRHQADVCHAYQIAHKNGIPDERIIVFQYDDLANSASNPFKGQIFNKPTTGAGVDVYAGCKKDYTGRDVTPENFLAALTGDKTKSGGKKVLESTAEDNVFIFFSDHGATGLIAFPSSYLYAADLNKALKTMNEKKMYKKLVFYLETCESGSMFEGLVDPLAHIYVTTASGPDESSWGTYCPPDDKVNGKSMNTCLGDLYSVNWMENADSVPLSETLQQQYEIIKTKTTLSKVMQYGDRSFTTDPISQYIGDVASDVSATESESPNPAGIVNSRDIPMHLAYYNYLRAEKSQFAERQALATALVKQLTSRMETDSIFMKLSKTVSGNETLFFAPTQRSAAPCGKCCQAVTQVYADHCGGFDDYSLQYMRVVANLCRHVSGSEEGIEKIASAMKAMCVA